ncbi:MAG TPA: DUF6442 family protein [Clostridia bacterium]|nr:DUF6442 family protein [Clostridia bacterium]
MKKEEILEKSRKTGIDEREYMIETGSFNWGLITVLSMVLFFGIWNWAHGVRSPELASIFAGYVTTTSFYKYKKLGSNKFLISSILAIPAVIAGAIAFFLGV